MKGFCNLVLKKDLLETKDFIIFPAPVANILFDKYGGLKITRLILSVSDDT